MELSDDKSWSDGVDEISIALGREVEPPPGTFDISKAAIIPTTKLEILTGRQIDRLSLFNLVAWVVGFAYGIARVSLEQVWRTKPELKLPNGKVIHLRGIDSFRNPIFAAEMCFSLLTSIFAFGLAVAFTVRIHRHRKKHFVTHEQIVPLLMVSACNTVFLFPLSNMSRKRLVIHNAPIDRCTFSQHDSFYCYLDDS